ncbi:MAG: histidine kinase, partial [Longimicrobiales bacterium]
MTTPATSRTGFSGPGDESDPPDLGPHRSDLPPGLRIGWRGIFLILGFWTFFGVVMAASLFLSPLRQTEQAAPAALVAFTFLGAYTWAALTLPLFWLTRRLGPTRDGGTRRVVRIVGLLGFSLVLAIVVSTGLALISSVVLQDLLGGSLAGTDGIWRMARYRFLNDLLACHLVLTAGVARDYFLRYRARQAEATLLRTQLVEARLQVLRTQLNPHFLFNTLNAVATLVTTDPRGVRRMIARLSDLLRYT